MASPISAQVILCDAAQADSSGKLHMLGAGWSITGTPTAPQAVAVLVWVPWDRANQKLPLTLQLLDADGKPVDLDNGPIRADAELEVGRPPGIAQGSPLNASFALNLGPMPLPPGRYEWRLEVADTTQRASFQVMEHPPGR